MTWVDKRFIAYMVLWECPQGNVLKLIFNKFMVPRDEPPLWARESMISSAWGVATPIAGGREVGGVDAIVQVEGVPPFLHQQLSASDDAGGNGQEGAIRP